MLHVLGSRAPRAEGCADCGVVRIRACEIATSWLVTPSIPVCDSGSGISTKNGAERTPREPRGPFLTPLLGSR
eukprot:7791270-Alexandrium_andersonii.AAC.1